MSRRRVVITGLGTVNGLDNHVPSFWNKLLNGASGVGPITLFDTSAFKVKFGGQVRELNLEPPIDSRMARRMDRFTQFALVASIAAMKDSGLELVPTAGDRETCFDVAGVDPFRFGVIIGSGIGGLNEFEEQHAKLITTKPGTMVPGKVSPFVIPKLMPNAASGQVSIFFGLRGPSFACASACASAANAIGDALRAIQYDEADLVVTGGSEAAMTPMGLAGFIQARALSERNDDPQRASRPWDKDRDGFVLSEGAGILVLEEYEHARQRGARIYAEVKGYAATGDAHNITAPCPDGSGAGAAMRLALRDAKVDPTDVEYVNAHGTSTTLGDAAETLAIKNVFGEHAKKLAVNSTKSMLGHTLGASGGVEAVVVALSIHQGKLHPTINLETPSPECDLDYVPGSARECRIRHAISNSFGFGGHNACLVFGAV